MDEELPLPLPRMPYRDEGPAVLAAKYNIAAAAVTNRQAMPRVQARPVQPPATAGRLKTLVDNLEAFADGCEQTGWDSDASDLRALAADVRRHAPAGNAPVLNADDEEPLPLPTMNFGQRAAGHARPTANGAVAYADDGDEEAPLPLPVMRFDRPATGRQGGGSRGHTLHSPDNRPPVLNATDGDDGDEAPLPLPRMHFARPVRNDGPGMGAIACPAGQVSAPSGKAAAEPKATGAKRKKRKRRKPADEPPADEPTPTGNADGEEPLPLPTLNFSPTANAELSIGGLKAAAGRAIKQHFAGTPGGGLMQSAYLEEVYADDEDPGRGRVVYGTPDGTLYAHRYDVDDGGVMTLTGKAKQVFKRTSYEMPDGRLVANGGPSLREQTFGPAEAPLWQPQMAF